MSELERIKRGPATNEPPPLLGLREVVLLCSDDAALTLSRIRNVLETVLKNEVEPTTDIELWAKILPSWFVNACVPELSESERQEFLSWPLEKRTAWGKKWSLADWLHWLQPSERQWEWWDAAVQSPKKLRILLSPRDEPFARGAFEWLCRCAGAVDVNMME